MLSSFEYGEGSLDWLRGTASRVGRVGRHGAESSDCRPDDGAGSLALVAGRWATVMMSQECRDEQLIDVGGKGGPVYAPSRPYSISNL